MERKEHKVDNFDQAGDVLKLLDSDGNPYTPEEPVDYQIIDEDGKILKEDTLKDSNEISLEGIKTRDFELLIEGHVVSEARGYEPPEDEKPQEPPEGPSFDFADPSKLDFMQENDDSDDESQSKNDDDDAETDQSDSDDNKEVKDDSDSDDQDATSDEDSDSDSQGSSDEDSENADSDDDDNSDGDGSSEKNDNDES